MTKQVIRDTSGNVRFECEADTIKEAAEKAVRYGFSLRRTVLRGADLTGADLGGAILFNADLSGADLYGAYLSGVDLRGADLYGANLYHANLSGILGIIAAGTPDGFTAYGWLRAGFLSIRVGCRERRLNQALAYWTKDKTDRREVRAAVKYIAKCAKARGWPLTEAEAGQ